MIHSGIEPELITKLIATAVILVGAPVTAWLLGRVLTRRVEDRYQRFYSRKFVQYGLVGLAVVAVFVIWQPFGGQFAAALGLATAGIAFAMQEVIGALAGWFNITAGRIFSIGDRIEMGGVRGDVIDITPLRTKLMEIGSTDPVGASWVKGRQHTGRMVAISNKATFTEPVYNFSSFFDFIWEEIDFLLPHHSNHVAGAEIIHEEATALSELDEALAAMDELRQRFPIPDTELLPRVFTRVEPEGVRLSGRFVVPTRTARSVIDSLTRRIEKRLVEEGIDLVHTQVVQAGPDWEPIAPGGVRW